MKRALFSPPSNAIDILASPLVLLGESLGTGVACAVAAQRTDSIKGALLITPFDSLASVAKKHYPWAPVSLILQDRYDSSRALQDLRLPLAIIVAEDDHIIPVDSAIRLFEDTPVQKTVASPRLGPQRSSFGYFQRRVEAAYEFANGR